MTVLSIVEAATILERHINIIKYTIFCLGAIVWILGLFVLGLSVSLRLDTELQEWIEKLNIWEFYLGSYILIFASLLIFIAPLLSCVSTYQEITQLLVASTAIQLLCFTLVMLGGGIQLENSSVRSGIQDSVTESFKNLIIHSYDPFTLRSLNKIQEEVGCCGTEGSSDYTDLRRRFPKECRDTVSGGAYSNSCTDEITSILEDKSSWLTGIAFTLGFLHVLIAVLSYILVQALQKEEKISYK